MNKRQILKQLHTVVSLVPRPMWQGAYIPDSRNRWHVVSETPDTKGLLLKNVFTDHEFLLYYDSIDQYRAPNLLLVRGHAFFTDERSVIIEPFRDAPSIKETEEPLEFSADRIALTEAELQKLTSPERLAMRQLLVQEKMTDTDVTQFLESRGLGPYLNLYEFVSNKVPFLDRDFFG